MQDWISHPTNPPGRNLSENTRKYVENITFPLSKSECGKVAKHKQNLDYLSRIKYECNISLDTKVSINDKVFVKDIALDLSFPFRCVGVKYEYGYDIANKKIKLELPYGSRNE